MLDLTTPVAPPHGTFWHLSEKPGTYDGIEAQPGYGYELRLYPLSATVHGSGRVTEQRDVSDNDNFLQDTVEVPAVAASTVRFRRMTQLHRMSKKAIRQYQRRSTRNLVMREGRAAIAAANQTQL